MPVFHMNLGIHLIQLLRRTLRSIICTGRLKRLLNKMIHQRWELKLIWYFHVAKTGSQYLETILTLVHHRLASDDPPPRRLPLTISPHSSLPIFPRSMQLNKGIIDSAAGFRSAVARGQHYRVRMRRPIWGCVDGCHKQLHRQVANDNGIIIAVASSSSRRPLARPPPLPPHLR